MANLHVRLVILFLIVLVSTCLSGFAQASSQTHNTVSLADTYNVVDPTVTMTISGGLSSSDTNNRVYDLTFESEQSGAAAATDNFIVEDIYYTPTNRYGGSGVEASLGSFTSTPSSNLFTAQFTVPSDTFATLVVPSSSFKIDGGNNVAAHWSNIVDFIDQKLTNSEQTGITAAILSQAGLTDVDYSNETAYQDAIAEAYQEAVTAGNLGLSTVTEIQTVINSVNAIAKVEAAAGDSSQAVAITTDDLNAIIGLSYVMNNVDAYRAAIAASTAGTLSTVDAIQNLINSVDAIAKVAAAAGVSSQAVAITTDDLNAIIGLSSVIDDYLGAYQAAIATSTAGSLSDVTKIQALITETNAAIISAIPDSCDSDDDCTSIAVTTTVAPETVSIRLFSDDVSGDGLSGINVNFDTGGASCSSVSATFSGTSGTTSLGTVVGEDASGNDVSAIVDISATEAGYVTLSCDYTAGGDYTIVVNGSFDGYGWQAEDAANVGAITAVNQWSNNITSLQGAFKGHSALTSVPSLPSGVTNTASMFEGATGFNQDIGDWDTGDVADMSSMFKGATAFNQDIGDWDTGVVEDMSSMFESATAFNQDISQWDISSVTDMGYMFISAELSVNHYDALITRWNTQLSGVSKSLQSVSFNGGTSKFCEAAVSGTGQDPSDPSDSANTVYDCSPRIIRVTLDDPDSAASASASASGTLLTLTVTFSEPVFTNDDGTGALQTDDFEVIFSHRVNGVLSITTPTSISQNGNSYTLGVSISGLGVTVDNDLVIEVLPKADSIHDAGGNVASDF